MPLCFSPHVTKKLDRLTQPLWRLPSESSRSFTSNSPRKSIVDSVVTREPSYTPRAQPNPEAKRVAVVGGGITGLSAAYHLALILPNAKITLFESEKRLGGWLHSELISVDDGEVLFEWGPRTLRTSLIGPGRHTAELASANEVSRILRLLDVNLLSRWLTWTWRRIFCRRQQHRLHL